MRSCATLSLSPGLVRVRPTGLVALPETKRYQ